MWPGTEMLAMDKWRSCISNIQLLYMRLFDSRYVWIVFIIGQFCFVSLAHDRHVNPALVSPCLIVAMHLSQIESRKLDWKVDSKVGSLDNAKHQAGGGEKKVT